MARNSGRFVLTSAVALLLLGAAVAAAVYPRKTPKRAEAFDQVDLMIPMRDGVKLHTILIVPKKPQGPLPILLQRTPYGIPSTEDLFAAPGFADLPPEHYVSAFQELRGRFKSEGDFEMFRPRRDSGDLRGVDESTDAYDTVDWLVKNVAGNSGKVGVLGMSYMGWTTQMALLDPHPAIQCASQRASPSDMFVNDDFHHNGALRLSYGFEFVYALESSKSGGVTENLYPFGTADTYDWYLQLGSVSHVNERYFHGKLPTWNAFVEHPNRDAYWQKRAFGTYLGQPVRVPNLIVAGWFDQEDFVGPIDIYNHVERFDLATQANHLVIGPWFHGGWAGDGTKLGPIHFGADRSKEVRETFRNWFDACLREGPPVHQPEAQIFETGTNRWREFDAWPPKTGVTPRRLYLRAGGKLSFDAPIETEEVFDEYVSDPANPVPYRKRPIGPTYAPPWEWMGWLVQDQRFVERRPDVLSWSTESLDREVVIGGDILAELFASTSGTDSDWVVKLIDVYPDGDKPPAQDAGADMRGYQLMVASEVIRGRFRNNLEKPEPVVANAVVKYGIDLHTRSHAFLEGHRIMVQVQSTWFPVIDRNPQKYVDNIYLARDEDFTRATQRVFRSRNAPSAIVLPMLQ